MPRAVRRGVDPPPDGRRQRHTDTRYMETLNVSDLTGSSRGVWVEIGRRRFEDDFRVR